MEPVIRPVYYVKGSCSSTNGLDETGKENARSATEAESVKQTERKGKPTICNTVGELIEKLNEFDQSTPLDLTAFCYADSERNKWVQIKRAGWRNNPGYDKPLDVFVEEHTYDGKTTFCRLSAECDQMSYDGPDFADDD